MATSLPPSSYQNVLRDKQIAALKRMMNLNQPIPRGSVAAAEPVWKVLIYDKIGSDIISPLLSVKELRDMGITLHLQVDSNREQIPDAVAIYFLMPTSANITRICSDCRAHLYDKYYLNFVTAIPRPLLEEVAKASLEADCVPQIGKVYDQYLNFITLEDDFFILRNQMLRDISYYALNRPDASDDDIQAICDSIVECLFSVFVTSGTIPIIQCPQGNAAEMVAQTLDKKLRDNVRDPRNSMFTGDSTSITQLSFSRPLLVILDRNVDLATPLHHTWTYQALVHDVLSLDMNRVTLSTSDDGPPPSPTSSSPRQQTYDLLHSDKFWQQHRGSPFPSMADAIQTAVDRYKTSEEEMKSLKSAMGAGEEEDESALITDKTSKLGSAIKSLPELMEKKNSIDMHTNIATALLEQIKERKLDVFFEMEDRMISKSSLDKTVLDMISDTSAGTPEDKMRLFIIYYILSPDMSEGDMTQYTSALEAVGANTASLTYLRQWKSLSRMKTPRGLGSYTASTTSVSSVVSTMSNWMNSGSKWMEGVKNLVVGTKNLPVTRIVEQLMEHKTVGQVTEDYCYFDPKQLRASDSRPGNHNKTPFNEAYVFVVGGGNYIEYQNLQDYCKRQQNSRHITYGTSQLTSANQFLQQLAELGST